MRKIGYAASIEKQKMLIKASIKLQLISMVLSFVFLWVFYSIGLACSAVLGGFCVLIPCVTSIFWHFRRFGVQNVNKVLANIYAAEAIKFILIVCLLGLAYSLAVSRPLLNPSGILIGFIVTYFSTLLMPLVAK